MQKPTVEAAAADPTARATDHQHISLDDLKKIRGGVGEPSVPARSPVEKSDEDFAKPVL